MGKIVVMFELRNETLLMKGSELEQFSACSNASVCKRVSTKYLEIRRNLYFQ